MPLLVNSQTGEQVNVSDAEASSLISSGNFKIPSSITNLIDPYGKRLTFNSSDPIIPEALAKGYRIESLEEEKKRYYHDNYDNPSLAAAAGVARGLSFGLTDVLGEKLGYGEALKGLKEENPEASLAGELGSIPLALLVPGGAIGKTLGGAVRGVEFLGSTAGRAAARGIESTLGLAASPGSKTLAKALSKGTELATQGIVEGAFYGAGQLVSEHALGDTELNAERVISEIGGNVLLSGAIGGSLGTMIGSLSPQAKKFQERIAARLDNLPISREKISEKLGEWADYQTIKSTGAAGRVLRKLEDADKLESSAKAIREVIHPDGKPLFFPGIKQKDIAKRMEEVVDATNKEIGSFINAVDETIERRSGFTNGYFANEIEKEVVQPLSKFGENIPVRKTFESIVDNIRSASASGEALEYSLRDIQDMKRVYANEAYNATVRSESKGIAQGYRSIERIYNKALEDAMEKNLPKDLFQRFIDLKKVDSDLISISENISQRASNLSSYRAFSLGDRLLASEITGAMGVGSGTISGSLATGMGTAALAYPATMGVSHVIRTRLPSALAVLFDKGSKLMATEKVANLSRAKEENLAKEIVLENLIKKKILGRNLRKETVKGINKSIDVSIEDGTVVPDEKIRDFVSEQAKIYAGFLRPEEKEKLTRSVLGELDDVAPEIANHLSNKLMSLASFMASKIPSGAQSINPLQPQVSADYNLSNEQAITYMRYLRASDNPYSVVEDIKNGVFNKEGIETLRVLYPKIFESIVRQSLEKIANTKEPIPFNKKVAIGVMFGLDYVDPSMDFNFAKILQSGIQTSNQEAQNQQIKQAREVSDKVSKAKSKSLTTMTQYIQQDMEMPD